MRRGTSHDLGLVVRRQVVSDFTGNHVHP